MDKFLRLKIKTKLTFGSGLLLLRMIVLLGGLGWCRILTVVCLPITQKYLGG